MQCPSCGFENIPGIEKCCACSTALASERSPENLHPPRARDRSMRQWLTWIAKERACRSGIVERVSGGYSSTSRYWENFRTADFPRLPSFRNLMSVLISVVPGLGHICIFDDARTGFRLLIGTLAALGFAALLYKTPISNLLLYCALGLSMFSVYSTVDRLFPIVRENARLMSRVATVLFIIASYLGLHFLLTLALRPVGMMVDVEEQPLGSILSSGDSVLLLREESYHHGDIIAGNYGAFGPVIGMPGDRIMLSDRVYVNGVPTGTLIPFVANAENATSSTAEFTLAADEYWVMPVVEHVGNIGMLVEAGQMRGNAVWGRAAVVVNPPAHRRLLGTE